MEQYNSIMVSPCRNSCTKVSSCRLLFTSAFLFPLRKNHRFCDAADEIPDLSRTKSLHFSRSYISNSNPAHRQRRRRFRAIPNLFSASVTWYGQFVRDSSRSSTDGREKKAFFRNPRRPVDSRSCVMRRSFRSNV